jgi:hypothetical protein
LAAVSELVTGKKRYKGERRNYLGVMLALFGWRFPPKRGELNFARKVPAHIADSH